MFHTTEEEEAGKRIGVILDTILHVRVMLS